MKIRCVVLLLISLLLIPALAAAQEPPAVTLSAEAGFDGYYRVGQWLPVQVQLQNDGAAIDGRVEVALPESDGGSVTYQYPVELPTQSRKEITLYLAPRRYTARLPIRLLDDRDQIIAQHDLPLKAIDPEDRLYGVLADQPSAFTTLAEIDPPDGQAITAQLTARHLPDRSAALDTLDTLIVSNIDTGALTTAQRSALAAWVANGGRLIISGGTGWQKTTAGLSDLLPVQPDDISTLPEAPALKAYANSPIDPGQLSVATGAVTSDALTVAAADGLPLITRRPYGFGEVYFLGFDPAALAPWEGLPGLYRQLLAANVEQPTWSHGVLDWNSAANAAAMIPNLNLPPASLMCGFVLLYMLVIGPINYLIVRRLKRRELAWITTPLLAVVFLLSTFLVGASLRGSEPVINRLALVEVWPAAARAHVTGVVGLYAPQRTAYAVQTEGNLLLRPPLETRPYVRSDTTAWTVRADANVQRVQADLDVSEVKTLSAEGDIAAPDIDVDTQIVVDSRGARVLGRVTNHSEAPLADAVLLTPGQSVEVGTLQPGESLPVDLVLDRAGRAPGKIQGAPYYYYNSHDTTLEDIAGSYFYNQPDRQRARRYEFASALLRSYDAPYRPRGDGVYLAAWSDEPSLPVSIDHPTFQAYDTTLYLVDLQPELRVMTGTLALPPGLFHWSSDNPDSSSIAPYDADIYPGTYELLFNLWQSVAYDTVQSLTLHLDSPNPGALAVAMWNYRTKSWTPLTHLQTGDNTIAPPAAHVGPGGEIKVQLAATGNSSGTRLNRLDFTLVVQ